MTEGEIRDLVERRVELEVSKHLSQRWTTALVGLVLALFLFAIAIFQVVWTNRTWLDSQGRKIAGIEKYLDKEWEEIVVRLEAVVEALEPDREETSE